MTTRWTLPLAGFGLLLLTSGCGKKGQDGAETTPPAAESPTPAPADGPTERTSMTDAECQTKGGTVVGDIGDGAIHRPEYRCENGEPPLGNIRSENGAPVAIEGAVCCPGGAAAP